MDAELRTNLIFSLNFLTTRTYTLYYGGLKLVPLKFKRLVILQSVHKVKLKLSLCFARVRFAKEKHDDNLISLCQLIRESLIF